MLLLYINYAKQRREQVRIEYYLSVLVAMDFKRPIATFLLQLMIR